MAWVKALPDGSINSWKDIYETFTARKATQTNGHILRGIAQGKKETLRGYIGCFTKVTLVMVGTYDELKC